MIKLRSALPLLLTLSALRAPAADSIDLIRVVPVTADQPIPVADFFRPPVMQDPKLNLAGTHIAALVTGSSDKVNLLVYELNTMKKDVVGGDMDLDVGTFDWLNDRRLIYNLSAHNRGNLGFLAVDLDHITRPYPLIQYYSESLLAVPPKDRLRPLIFAGYDSLETQKQVGAVVIDSDIQSGRFVDMSTINSLDTNATDAKNNNNLHIIKRYPQPDNGWTTGYIADQMGGLDFATTAANGINTLHHLTGDTWRDCPVDLDLIDPVGPGSKPGELAVVGPRNTGKPRPLQFMDGATGQFGEVLIEDKEYDFNGYLYRDPGSRAIVGAVYERNGPKVVWFNETYSKRQEVLNALFPGVIARLIGNNENGDRLLVSTYSDRQPPIFQWVDLATKKAGLFNSAPWIDPKRMQPMNPIKFKTRDGKRLDAYVTMPAGASKQNPPPLVVLPHDGPLARDTWGYNNEVQFLASRGYAVLQPNYRGSRGYAWMFPESDDWDYAKMSDDVTDATKALISSGLVDGKRVAIMGTNFGGYLALQGATSEPGLYRCAAAITGIFDWELLVNDAKFNRYTDPTYGRWVRKLGDPDKDKARYDALSPIHRINRLHIPVFTAVGREDSQQNIAQTKSLVSELERNNVPHEGVTLGGVGRGMAYVKNRVEVYTRIETFLANNLK